MASLQSTSVTGSLDVSGSIKYLNIPNFSNPPSGAFGESNIFEISVSDGTLDTGFDPNVSGNFFTEVVSIAIQSDGKILIGGSFTTVSGTTRNNIARLNADGTLDGGFDPNAGGAVEAIAIQSDGKILIGGSFTTVDSTSRNRIARLNADGTLDGGFNPNASSTVNDIAIQSDGKILIGGGFTTVGGTSRNRIARLNADGTVDGSFNPGTGANNTVRAIAIQSDGKILIGGGFTTVRGTTRNRIARLNADGTLDGSFNPGTGADNTVWSIAIQSDGKILVGGQFITVDGTTRNRIARLNVDGTLDVGFDPNASSTVWSIAIQSDNKILIGGGFSSVGGTTRRGIARLNRDGTLDGGFDPGISITDNTYAITIQSDGKILIGGDFTSVGGTSRNLIARLSGISSIYGLCLYTDSWKAIMV